MLLKFRNTVTFQNDSKLNNIILDFCTQEGRYIISVTQQIFKIQNKYLGIIEIF